MPEARPGAKAKKAGKDPALATVKRTGDAEIRRFLMLVVEAVPYSSFVDAAEAGREPLTIRRFERLRTVAVLERFLGFTAQEISQKLDCGEALIKDSLADPLYSVIREAVEAAGRELGQKRTIDEWAEKAEDAVAQELVLSALHEPSPRDRLKAAEALADRRSAKKSRDGEDKKGLFFPADLLEKMQVALTMGPAGLTLTAEPVPDAIDGAMLNVPKQIGRGTTEQ